MLLLTFRRKGEEGTMEEKFRNSLSQDGRQEASMDRQKLSRKCIPPVGNIQRE